MLSVIICLPIIFLFQWCPYVRYCFFIVLWYHFKTLCLFQYVQKNPNCHQIHFQLLAQLSENFIFIYLGLSLFTEVELVFKPMLIIVAFIAICVARWSAVFPLSRFLNFLPNKIRKIFCWYFINISRKYDQHAR